MSGKDPGSVVALALTHRGRGGRPTEKAMALAAELGIKVPVTITAYELGRLIDDSPATPAQVRWVEIALNYAGLLMPLSITFAQASKVLGELLPLIDERVLMEQGWKVDSELTWRGRLYRITRVYRDFRVALEPIAPSDSPEEPDRSEVGKRHHPFTLLETYAEQETQGALE